MNTEKLMCPVCGQNLTLKGKSLVCEGNHTFDIAKEGYVNLLCGSHKAGELIGDNKNMAQSRRVFLDKGYFSSLSSYLAGLIPAGAYVLDICCGEGYYSACFAEKSAEVYGFDLSKEMVKLAAKRKLNGLFFVANLSAIPVKSNSIDLAFHLFAPFNGSEFARVLKDDGVLYTVVPGKNHLFSLKEVLYDTPYYNDEKLPDCPELQLVSKDIVSAEITLESKEDIDALFRMTPYYYHTSDKDKSKLENTDRLSTTVEFVIGGYRKAENGKG